MNSSFQRFWEAAYQIVDGFFARLPSLIVGVVFLLFYVIQGMTV